MDNVETKKKSGKRKWVVTAAVVFFAVIILLTFFSNTIMNYSLPKVSAQDASYGIISTSNRATGVIEAAGKVDVKAFDTRKVTGVYVYEYNDVFQGDLLMTLEPLVESEELELLRDQLEEIELQRYYESKLPVNTPDYTYLEDAISDAQEALNTAKTDLSNANNKSTIVTNAETTIANSSALIITLSAEIESLSDIKANFEQELADAEEALAAVPDGDDDSVEQAEVDRLLGEIAAVDTQLSGKAAQVVTEQGKIDAAELVLDGVENYLPVADAQKAVTRAEKTLKDAKTALSDQKKIDAVEREKKKRARDEEDKLIDELKKKIESIEENMSITEIRAPISGQPIGFSFSAGDEIMKDQVLGTIVDRTAGYKADLIFTAQQARSMYIGMNLQVNQYTADRAMVIGIRPDPNNPRDSRIVTASVEGEYLYVGANLDVSFDDYNQQFPCVVPNSSIHEDGSGKFVYLLNKKSGPLGDRYTALKVSVEVLATDGKVSALDPSAIQGRQIITRSEKPIANGDQVRLEYFQQED
jgi:multidrug efflux pump subunit AcrA (membrane-fusion protein)